MRNHNRRIIGLRFPSKKELGVLLSGIVIGMAISCIVFSILLFLGVIVPAFFLTIIGISLILLASILEHIVHKTSF